MGRPRKVRGVCTKAGCGKAERSGGLCSGHYTAAWRKAHAQPVPPLPAWSAEAVAWVAGLLEARGMFRVREREGGSKEPLVRLTAVDAAVPRRVCKLLGIGWTAGPYRNPRARHKEVWHWGTGNRRHIRALCAAIRPWMSPHCLERMDKMLGAIPPKE